MDDMNSVEKHSILVVEDDSKLAGFIKSYLEQYEFSVGLVHNGLEGIEVIKAQQPALVILDLMLPGTDGLNVCRQVRSDYRGFILMLTAVEENMDQVAAIELGVDDYVVKPIQLRVLLARDRMLLRREREGSNNASFNTSANDSSAPLPRRHSDQLTFDLLTIQKKQQTALFAEQDLNLSVAEFELFWLLASHPEEVMSRESLIKELRGLDYDGQDRSIDTRIVGIRKKIGDNTARPSKIITVRNKGYLFVPDAWGST